MVKKSQTDRIMFAPDKLYPDLVKFGSWHMGKGKKVFDTYKEFKKRLSRVDKQTHTWTSFFERLEYLINNYIEFLEEYEEYKARKKAKDAA